MKQPIDIEPREHNGQTFAVILTFGNGIKIQTSLSYVRSYNLTKNQLRFIETLENNNHQAMNNVHNENLFGETRGLGGLDLAFPLFYDAVFTEKNGLLALNPMHVTKAEVRQRILDAGPEKVWDALRYEGLLAAEKLIAPAPAGVRRGSSPAADEADPLHKLGI